MTQKTNNPGPVSWVLEDADVEQLLEAIAGSSEVVMDLETTGLDEHAFTNGPSNGGVAARVSVASFTLPQREDFDDLSSAWDLRTPTTYVIPLSHLQSPFRGVWRAKLRELVQQIRKYRRPFVNANVKFDARWVYATTGVDLADLIAWDTQVSSHLINENASTKLKVRAPEVFGIDPWDDGIDFSTPGAGERIELFHLMWYAALDTYWTWRLFQHHRISMYLPYGDFNPVHEPPMSSDERLDARIGTVATWIAMPTVQALTRIEQRGFAVDTPWIQQHLDEVEQIKIETLDQLAARYGQDRSKATTAATSGWFKELTEHAVSEGELRIASLTPNGNPQWSKGVLKRQARTGSKLAEVILANRDATKKAEYLRSWLVNTSQQGTIHSTYWPGRVVTGRLSSTDPNMQQVTKSLRPAFIPRPGYVIADFDYSQIELRVAAYISRCQPMIDAYNRGDDLHKMIAAQVVGKAVDEVTGDERQMGKPVNFGFLYGMSAEGFVDYADDAYNVQFTLDQAETARTAYFDLWDGLTAWHAQSIATAKRQGYVVSPLGRVRRVPDIWDTNGRSASHAARQAINSPVQGMASDLLMMAAASMQGFLYGSTPIDGMHLVATVHDSLVAEVREDDWQDICLQVTDRMANLDSVLARMGVEFDVPLVADATVGTRWGLSDVGEL